MELWFSCKRGTGQVASAESEEAGDDGRASQVVEREPVAQPTANFHSEWKRQGTFNDIAVASFQGNLWGQIICM